MANLSNIDSSVKEALLRELKDNYGRYMKLLQRWFQHQLSKEDFDRLARSLFPNGDVKTHNRFILSIMASCQAVDSQPTAAKRPRHSKNLRHRFTELPQMPLISLISEYQTSLAKQNASQQGKKDFSVVTTSCVREQLLPGSWMLYGRVMNTLQLYSLHDFTPEALNCLAQAAHCLVRRLLQSALAGRRCCRLAPAGTQPQPPQQQQQQQLERTSFGRVPIARLSMSDGYVAAVGDERLNAYLHSATDWSSSAAGRVVPADDEAEGGGLPGGGASGAAAATEETEQRQRIQALLRCDSGGVMSSAAFVLHLEDLRKALTQPDSHLVGYQCVQRQHQPVASHFVRFLSQSRAINRLRAQQQLELANGDLTCVATAATANGSTAAAAAASTVGQSTIACRGRQTTSAGGGEVA